MCKTHCFCAYLGFQRGLFGERFKNYHDFTSWGFIVKKNFFPSNFMTYVNMFNVINTYSLKFFTVTLGESPQGFIHFSEWGGRRGGLHILQGKGILLTFYQFSSTSRYWAVIIRLG